MRINEIASAEDQMALWRLVSDSVWQAIETQRQQQAQAAQAKAAKAKLKPRGGRKGGKAKLSIPMPPTPKTPPAKKPEASTKPEQTKAQNGQLPVQGQQFSQRQPPAQSIAAAVPATPTNASIAPKDRVFSRKVVQNNPRLQGDDRHSKNGIPVTPNQKLNTLGIVPRVV